MSYPQKEIDEFVFTKFQDDIIGRIEKLNRLVTEIEKSPLLTLDQAPMTYKVREEIIRYTKLLLVDAAKGEDKNK